MKVKTITGSRPIEVHGLKIRFIKSNYETWNNYIIKNLYNEFKITEVDPILENQDFYQIVGRHEKSEKSWKLFKSKIQSLYVKKSEETFRQSKAGKIYKKYNQRWFKNNILYKLRCKNVDTLIRLRTGTSELKYHTSIKKINEIRLVFC